MWNEMMALQAPLAETILRTTLVYLAVVFLIRLIGKRGLAELSTFDIIVTVLVAEVVGGAAIGADDSLTGGLVSALVLIILNTAVHHLVQRSSAAERIFQGKPATVIRDGQMAEGALRKLGISPSELDHAIRSQHGDDVTEVDHAELTPSGKLVLTLKHDEQSATKADIAELGEQLHQIETFLTSGGDRRGR
jgi:uncharacterized membrane protein YcaP (DUF421 family)